MKKVLDILIPRYTEQWKDISPLLKSLAIQQNVDFSKIGVIIRSDGYDEFTDIERLYNFPFSVDFDYCDKRGVSATRNACLDASEADYVMFCDADDMFSNVCGLWILFREFEGEGFDTLVSTFLEETRTPDKKEVTYINREMDQTFVHGKVHRRKYLTDNHIRWNEKLTIHEDSYFNILCQSLTEKAKHCPTPFYLWRWRDESVCRHDEKYILKTFNNMIDSNDALIAELKRREREDKAKFFIVFMVFDAYYLMNKPEWKNQENKKYRDATERRFAKYYRKHRKDYDSVGANDKMMISNQVRGRHVMEGMEMENLTISEWLDKILKDNKKG
ncbi:MAG: glycosyltransferase family 2 protein [Mogibacterium sp.]|nr:glycosyltransferase family 2 protein [Mogibacterium sp.]MCF0239804.1 glycosyltransferase family 2 protein [Streptococcus gallolyticus]